MRDEIWKPASLIGTMALVPALFVCGADPHSGGLGLDHFEIIFGRI
jgi:hypothetical protein